MPESVNQAYIFVPMLMVVLLTIITFVRMSAARGATMKEMDASYYRAHLGAGEPESTTAAARHYGNYFEMPTLFYAGCLTAFVLSGVGQWTVLFAWGYVVLRLVQSVIHGTYNNPVHRGMAFMLSSVFMIALWINIGIVVAGKL
ncbi:MAG: MAPEG family protein [Sphingomonadaceae bacterium]|nr:MAPEG family protein [Sphingomonadaceae bacterium]